MGAIMKEKRRLHPGTGLATIVLIFVILSMTIMALFTYMRVQQDHRSLMRDYEQKQQYYHADAQAKYIVQEFLKGINVEEQTHIDIKEVGNRYEFEIPISSSQVLFVCFDHSGNIYDWQIQTRNEE